MSRFLLLSSCTLEEARFLAVASYALTPALSQWEREFTYKVLLPQAVLTISLCLLFRVNMSGLRDRQIPVCASSQ